MNLELTFDEESEVKSALFQYADSRLQLLKGVRGSTDELDKELARYWNKSLIAIESIFEKLDLKTWADEIKERRHG